MGASGHIAAIPKQTYDLDRSNRFLVGNLPGNRLCERRELLLAFRSTAGDRLVPREFRLACLYDRKVIAGEPVDFGIL